MPSIRQKTHYILSTLIAVTLLLGGSHVIYAQSAGSNATTTRTTQNQITAAPSTTNSNSNQFFPTNYYLPLDSLSPEFTYGLSALAMIFGIAGAVLIIREPREKVSWTPNLNPRSLLEN